METLKIKKLHPDAHVPTRAHDTDAGMDLYALPVEYTDKEKSDIKNKLAAKALLQSATAFDLLWAATDSDWEQTFAKGIFIFPHETVMVPTGIAVAVPTGYMGCIYARSGLASKHGLAPANCVGIVDSDYRGEVKVALHNYSNEPYIVDVGDRIAQLVIQPISLCTPVEVEELDETDRGVGGFGSSGKK
ncbi:MAG: dUTP diphosphatase [Neglectibacter timonensis]